MRRAAVPAVALAMLAGCPGGGGEVDAMVDTAVPDAATDAPVDAFEQCPGQLLFTGDYVDWDSTEFDFLGIFGAELRDLANPAEVVTTAPNGRGLLCVTAGDDTEVSFTHADYLPMTFSMSHLAAAAGPFSTRGLLPARLATLFADELALTPDPADALVLVEVRRLPGGEPIIGATVALGNTHDGAFTQDATGAWQAGASTTNDAWVLLANVSGAGPVDGDGGTRGSTTITVTPPDGVTCTGRGTLALASGELAATTFACQ